MSEEIEKWLNDEDFILAYRFNFDGANEVNENLKNHVKQLQKENKELSKEILDKTTVNITLKRDRDYWQNVVNEFEKWLKERLSTKPLLTTYSFEIDGKQKFVTEIEEKELNVVLDKLKELKEETK